MRSNLTSVILGKSSLNSLPYKSLESQTPPRGQWNNNKKKKAGTGGDRSPRRYHYKSDEYPPSPEGVSPQRYFQGDGDGEDEESESGRESYHSNIDDKDDEERNYDGDAEENRFEFNNHTSYYFEEGSRASGNLTSPGSIASSYYLQPLPSPPKNVKSLTPPRQTTPALTSQASPPEVVSPGQSAPTAKGIEPSKLEDSFLLIDETASENTSVSSLTTQDRKTATTPEQKEENRRRREQERQLQLRLKEVRELYQQSRAIPSIPEAENEDDEEESGPKDDFSSIDPGAVVVSEKPQAAHKAPQVTTTTTATTESESQPGSPLSASPTSAFRRVSPRSLSCSSSSDNESSNCTSPFGGNLEGSPTTLAKPQPVTGYRLGIMSPQAAAMLQAMNDGTLVCGPQNVSSRSIPSNTSRASAELNDVLPPSSSSSSSRHSRQSRQSPTSPKGSFDQAMAGSESRRVSASSSTASSSSSNRDDEDVEAFGVEQSLSECDFSAIGGNDFNSTTQNDAALPMTSADSTPIQRNGVTRQRTATDELLELAKSSPALGDSAEEDGERCGGVCSRRCFSLFGFLIVLALLALLLSFVFLRRLGRDDAGVPSSATSSSGKDQVDTRGKDFGLIDPKGEDVGGGETGGGTFVADENNTVGADDMKETGRNVDPIDVEESAEGDLSISSEDVQEEDAEFNSICYWDISGDVAGVIRLEADEIGSTPASFGHEVAVSADATTIVVGDYQSRAYVYDYREGGGWNLSEIVEYRDFSDVPSNFGQSVTVSEGGHRVGVSITELSPQSGFVVYRRQNANAVNERSDDEEKPTVEARSSNGGTNIFARNEDSAGRARLLMESSPENIEWSNLAQYGQIVVPLDQQTVPPDTDGLHFAGSLAMSADGRTIAALAYVPEYRYNEMRWVAYVIVYRYGRRKAEWQQLGQVIDVEMQLSWGGRSSVSISGDGRLVAVGGITSVFFGDVPGKVNIGAKVYGYSEDADRWLKYGRTMVGQSRNSKDASVVVSLSTNGKVLAFGAANDDRRDLAVVEEFEQGAEQTPGNGAAPPSTASRPQVEGFEYEGVVRVYQYDSATSTGWVPLGRSVITGGAIGERLGYSLSTSGEGDRIVVGVPGGGNGAGYVDIYDYDKDRDSWERYRFVGPDKDDPIGSSVDINYDGTVVVAGHLVGTLSQRIEVLQRKCL